MNKRNLFSMLIIVLMALTIAPAALADHSGAPSGACPDGFDLHHVAQHDHHQHDEGKVHRHVGFDSDMDLNGDGYWCVKHVDAAQHIHVHIDNNVPLS